MDDELDIFGQPVQYSIGQNVLYDEGADQRTINDANDFAATYKNKEMFGGKEAANEWARTQGLEYGVDASRVDAFLENETYVPGAYLNNEVDFTVGGYDTDLETEGFQASDPGVMIVTGDEDVNATITYPNDPTYGISAGSTVDAGTVFGTPDLVVGEPVSGTGGFTMLNPGGVSFESGSALNSAYNILAQNGAGLLGANEAARDIGSGMNGDMWIATYEGILPDAFIAMVADAYGIEWEPKKDDDEEDDSDFIIPDDGDSGFIPGGDTGFTPGSGTGLTGNGGITTIAEGPGGSYPNIGYYTDEGYGPYFTPDSSYSSVTPYVSPYTGNTIANLLDVGVNPAQFLGGPPTSTTNQPLSSFGYSEDTFAPSVGGIFNLDNFKDLNVKGLTFANYKGSGNTSVITGGVNGANNTGIGSVAGSNDSILTGGNTGLTPGIVTPGNTNLDPNVTTDYDSTIEDVDTIEFDDGSLTGNPFLDFAAVRFGGELLTGGLTKLWEGMESLINGGQPTNIITEFYNDSFDAYKEYNPNITKEQFDAEFGNEFDQLIEENFEKDIVEEWRNSKDSKETSTENVDKNNGNDNNNVSTNDIFDADFLTSINFGGNSADFLTGLNSLSFGGTQSVTDAANSTNVKFTYDSPRIKTFFPKDLTDPALIDQLDPSEVLTMKEYISNNPDATSVSINSAGEIVDAGVLESLNSEVVAGFEAITPEFVTDAFKTIGDAIPPGVKEALVYVQMIGGGIEAYTNAVKFIDDPEPESALRAAAGVMMMVPGLQPLAIATKAFAEVVDAVFGGYDQQPHRTVYSNIDFDDWSPLSYSQGDYRSDRSASEGVNMFMNGVGELISPDIESLEEEYGIDIKGDLQLAYSDLDGFAYTIGNEDVTGFTERLDARDGGVDTPEGSLYRRNLGTFDFENPENLQDQLIEFKETIIGDIRRALDAGYTDFSNFHQVMKDIDLGEEWEIQKEATGYNDMELMSFLGTQLNPMQTGPNPAGDLFSWGIRNYKTNAGYSNMDNDGTTNIYGQMASQYLS